MVNEQYEPDAVENRVIELLRAENRVNAPLVVKRTELPRADVNHALRNLATAGWCQKLARGLYEYVEDPRVVEDASERARDETPPETGSVSSARDVLAAWEPDDANTERARAAATEVVTWLAAEGGARQKGDILAWAADRELGFSESTLWFKVVRPALGELADAGLATHTRNVGWEIVDDE